MTSLVKRVLNVLGGVLPNWYLRFRACDFGVLTLGCKLASFIIYNYIPYNTHIFIYRIQYVRILLNIAYPILISFYPLQSFYSVSMRFVMFNLFQLCRKNEIFRSTLLPKPATLLPKRQQCGSNIRHCRKNRSTCSARQCCFDIVASMDGA